MTRTVSFGINVVDVLVVSPHRRSWKVLVLRRAASVRCPGSWEMVHGSVERGELPHESALREVREETGLVPDRLYNVTTHAFYLHKRARVELAIAFCAFVSGAPRVTLGNEHTKAEWLSRADAAKRFAWPRERECLTHAWSLFGRGDAGPMEDVLRIR